MIVGSPLSPFHLKIKEYIISEKSWIFETEMIKQYPKPQSPL